jgi:hypothetical protein
VCQGVRNSLLQLRTLDFPPESFNSNVLAEFLKIATAFPVVQGMKIGDYK